MGSWSGTLSVDGRDFTVDPDAWLGTRDRSWGIRPSGESDPPGRWAAEPREGFWWTYIPLRFSDYTMVVILQESPDGHRTLSMGYVGARAGTTRRGSRTGRYGEGAIGAADKV